MRGDDGVCGRCRHLLALIRASVVEYRKLPAPAGEALISFRTRQKGRRTKALSAKWAGHELKQRSCPGRILRLRRDRAGEGVTSCVAAGRDVTRVAPGTARISLI